MLKVLKLGKETLRKLDNGTLEGVAGGGNSGHQSCASECTCPTSNNLNGCIQTTTGAMTPKCVTTGGGGHVAGTPGG